MEKELKIEAIKENSKNWYNAALYAYRLKLYILPIYHPDDPEDRSPKGRRGKAPITSLVPNGFKDATNDVDTILKWFREKPNANIGVVPGPSGLIGFDIDGQQGIDTFNELTEKYGIELGWYAETGREEGGFHCYFPSPDFAVKNVPGWKEGIDLRHYGGYLILPPSVHESGKEYQWIDSPLDYPQTEPLPEEFLSLLPRGNTDKNTEKSEPAELLPCSPSVIGQCWQYVSKCSHAISGQGGHNQTYHIARVIFYDFGLSKAEGLPIMEEYNQRCEPPWSNSELNHKIEDSIRNRSERPRGWRRDCNESEFEYSEGEYNLKIGKYVFNPSRTLPVAETFLKVFYDRDGFPVLKYYAGKFWEWTGNSYRIINEIEIKEKLLQFLTDSVCLPDKKQFYAPFPAKERIVKEALEALKVVIFLPNNINPGAWIGGDDGPPHDSRFLIYGETCVFNWKTNEYYEHDPRWFNQHSLPFDVDMQAPAPETYLRFLKDLFGEIKYPGCSFTSISDCC